MPGTGVAVEHRCEALDVAEAEEASEECHAMGVGGQDVPGQHHHQEDQRDRQQRQAPEEGQQLALDDQKHQYHQSRQHQAHRPLGQHGDGAEQGHGHEAQTAGSAAGRLAVAEKETEQAQGDGTGQKHVGDRTAAPADPSRIQRQQGRAEGCPPPARAQLFLARGAEPEQPEARQHHGTGRKGHRQARGPLAHAEQAKAEGHHPVPPDGVIKEKLAIPHGGDPVTPLNHLTPHLHEQGLGLVHQAEGAEVLKERQPAEQQIGEAAHHPQPALISLQPGHPTLSDQHEVWQGTGDHPGFREGGWSRPPRWWPRGTTRGRFVQCPFGLPKLLDVLLEHTIAVGVA